MMWNVWWVWIVAGFSLGVLEILAPGYIFLGFAIVAEVIGTTALKASDSFTRPIPSLVTVGCYALSFYLLTFSLRVLPTGIAYAIYTVSLRWKPPVHWKSLMAVPALAAALTCLPLLWWEASRGELLDLAQPPPILEPHIERRRIDDNPGVKSMASSVLGVG